MLREERGESRKKWEPGGHGGTSWAWMEVGELTPRNATCERKTCSLPEMADSGALWANRASNNRHILTQPEVTNDVLSSEQSPGMRQRWDSLSLPPDGAHDRSFVTYSGVSRVPKSHNLGIPRAHQSPPVIQSPSLLVWAGRDTERADLHRNTGNNHILLICADPILLYSQPVGLSTLQL